MFAQVNEQCAIVGFRDDKARIPRDRLQIVKTDASGHVHVALFVKGFQAVSVAQPLSLSALLCVARQVSPQNSRLSLWVMESTFRPQCLRVGSA